MANNQIVTHKLNHGAYISSPTIKEARDLFEARRGIEQLVVRLVCAKKPKMDLSALKTFVHHEAHAYQKGAKATNSLSGDFHIILAGLTNNEVIRALVERLVVRTNLVQAVYGPPSICLVHEHNDILEALAAFDSARAIKLMDRHFDRGGSRPYRACAHHGRSRVDISDAAISYSGSLERRRRRLS